MTQTPTTRVASFLYLKKRGLLEKKINDSFVITSIDHNKAIITGYPYAKEAEQYRLEIHIPGLPVIKADGIVKRTTLDEGDFKTFASSKKFVGEFRGRQCP